MSSYAESYAHKQRMLEKSPRGVIPHYASPIKRREQSPIETYLNTSGSHTPRTPRQNNILSNSPTLVVSTPPNLLFSQRRTTPTPKNAEHINSHTHTTEYVYPSGVPNSSLRAGIPDGVIDQEEIDSMQSNNVTSSMMQAMMADRMLLQMERRLEDKLRHYENRLESKINHQFQEHLVSSDSCLTSLSRQIEKRIVELNHLVSISSEQYGNDNSNRLTELEERLEQKINSLCRSKTILHVNNLTTQIEQLMRRNEDLEEKVEKIMRSITSIQNLMRSQRKDETAKSSRRDEKEWFVDQQLHEIQKQLLQLAPHSLANVENGTHDSIPRYQNANRSDLQDGVDYWRQIPSTESSDPFETESDSSSLQKRRAHVRINLK